MRTTLNIDDDLLDKATKLAGPMDRTAVVREGLKALIERESARRLARLGGSQPTLSLAPRRRSDSPQADAIRRPPPEGVSQLGSGPALTLEPQS